MQILKNIYKKWDAYWFPQVSPYPMSAFRILFGIFLFWYFLNYLFKIEAVFSNHGVYLPVLVPDIAPPPIGAYAIYALTMALILCFILGLYTRLVTPLLLLSFLYHYFLNLAVYQTSFDILIIYLLTFLSITTLDKVWSIRFFWTQNEEEVNPLIMGWSQRFLCLYVCVVYFGMVAYKLTDLDWYSGLKLEMNLHGVWGTPAAHWLISLGLPLGFYTFMTFFVIFVELLCSFGLYVRRIQYFVFFLGFCLHFFIGVFLSIWEFMFLPAMYILYVEPAKVKRWGELLWQALGFNDKLDINRENG